MKNNLTAAVPWQIAASFPNVCYRRFAKRRYAVLALFLSTIISQLSTAHAQSYSIDWYKIAGGGGTSTNGNYQVTGTIGQPDASGAMSGGQYSVTGGYWAMINVVQMPGVPNLLIVPNGANSVKILWPDPTTNTYTLQQSANLAPGNGWATSSYTVTPGNGTNSVTISPPTGNLFFRLANP